MGHSAAKPNDVSGTDLGLLAAYGFIPNLFQEQDKLPGVVDAEARLIHTVVVSKGDLSRQQKESLLHCVARIRENDYCLTLHRQDRPITASEADSTLLKFAAKLAKYGPWFSANDFSSLRAAGFGEPAILEAVATIALGQMLCTLADGLHPALDSERGPEGPTFLPEVPQPLEWAEPRGPYLSAQPPLAVDHPANVVLREQFGFVPNIFKLQALSPDLLGAEVGVLESILFPEDHLTRVQKEHTLLMLSAANLNTYFVAVHSQILDAMGVPLEQSDRVVQDYRQAGLPAGEVSLLDELRKLAMPLHSPGQESERNASEESFNNERLRQIGFTDTQVVEAVATAALTNFLNTLQFGLGAVPDFPPRRVFSVKDLYRRSNEARPTFKSVSFDDPDAEFVARVQNGELDAFEELVRRHTRRLVGTLGGILGDMDEARDATQDVFLKAFEHIGRFQGRSRFSTWLTSIAINTGTEILRKRRPSEPLEEDEEWSFRPLHIQNWTENPEQLFATSQLDLLVRQAVLALPEKYRVAVLLRDINQLPTEDAAAALDLSVPALKARVLRGRLMLRERLAPHFVRSEKTDA
jgi:RNA polymerase sigma-70 factor (ECF subfamily)